MLYQCDQCLTKARPDLSASWSSILAYAELGPIHATLGRHFQQAAHVTALLAPRIATSPARRASWHRIVGSHRPVFCHLVLAFVGLRPKRTGQRMVRRVFFNLLLSVRQLYAHSKALPLPFSCRGIA